MGRPGVVLLSSCVVLLAANAAATLPPGVSWLDFASKPAYARALGPPASLGFDTISVPYVPKSPLFPKFVDPKTMISKKTDMLGNLFGGLGPASYGPSYAAGGYKPFSPFGPFGAQAPAAAFVQEGFKRSAEDEKASAPVKAIEKVQDEAAKETKRAVFGPFGPYGSFGSFGPKFGGAPFGGGSKFGGPSYSPFSEPSSAFSDKEIWSRKRRAIEASAGKSKTKEVGPPPAYPGLSPIPEESEFDLNDPAAYDKPTEYLPGIFSPFGAAVDPSMFISKKTTFLNTLFSNLATSTPSTIPAVSGAPKPTIVPPDFWFPASMFSGASAPSKEAPSYL